jgi:hypothetical protein
MLSSKYVGQVPNGTVHGDVICIILGAAVPFELRTIGDAVILLGPCYLHGLMKAEALTMEQFKAEDIQII